VTSSVPLCVDLDGTLIRSDLLWESLARVLKRRPWALPLVPFWLLRSRAYLKQQLAARSGLDSSALPYNEALLERLRKEKAQGRALFLVTASDVVLAREVAAHLQIFEGVIASDGSHNLRGENKAAMLVARFGEKGFDYVGDSPVDEKVWMHARRAWVAGRNESVARAARKKFTLEAEFPVPSRPLRGLGRLLRPHQWVKNLIVFVPLITSHQINRPEIAVHGALAFVAFCLCASGVYVMNDLLDLEADRHHATKRFRPIAAGDVSVLVALLLGPLSLAGGIALAGFISLPFVGVVLLYVSASCAYSWRLKRAALVDVFVLAGLYTLRLIAGHVATGVEFSEWLLAFSMFLFLSLALVKRFQEVQRLRGASQGIVAGRGYTLEDLEVLTPLGAASGYLSVLVLALYVNSEKVRLLYHRPVLLLLVCPLLLYWISRVWLVAHRGRMHDDPVVFALKDKQSYLVGLLTLLFVWLAT
jgi:4-hydroxybenzoate polyprenyltransferase